MRYRFLAVREHIAETLQVAIPTVDRELKKIKTILATLAGEENH